jgi:alpha-amylase
MFQAYEWNTNRDGYHWDRIADMSDKLNELGISSVWLPPAYKGMLGVDDTGYNPYDLYDLGEFHANNTDNGTRTRYGTKDQYINMINRLHDRGLKVYADVVLNHKAGGEAIETVQATMIDPRDRNRTLGTKTIGAYSVFNFDVKGSKRRNNKYSSCKGNASCFDAVDWDGNVSTEENWNRGNVIYLLNGKSWDDPVDNESGNYDYLANLDVDFECDYVVEEYKRWGAWYAQFANLDGFRLDAVKHIKFDFFKDWLRDVRRTTGKDLYSVAEYLDGNMNDLTKYVEATEGETDVFDFPLWYRFRDVSKGSFDLRNLFKGTLSEKYPDLAVTFVENHDTQPGKEIKSKCMENWFKGAAYATILTRGGKACVFYGDYYGTNKTDEFPETVPEMKDELETLLKIRKNYAYGEQIDYLNNPSYIGWVRKGDEAHEGSGLATVITNSYFDVTMTMNVGQEHAGETWYDATGNVCHTVTIDQWGNGNFTAKGRNNGKCYSVWVKR